MPGRTQVKDGPHPVDIHVGNRIRIRRVIQGMSQEVVAAALNLSFQQLQKYEKGSNRVSASRLFELGQILGVPTSYFFEEMQPTSNKDGSPVAVSSETQRDVLTKRETLELVRGYYGIQTPEIRDHVRRLIVALGKE